MNWTVEKIGRKNGLTDEQKAELTALRLENPEMGRRLLAKHTGISSAKVRTWLQNERKRARAGNAPEYDYRNPQPEGYAIKGISTLYGANGEIQAQWVKTKEDREQILELLELAVESIIEPAKGLYEPRPKPVQNMADLLSVYPVVDAHIGLYAWAEEAGEDWDTDKAEEVLNRGSRHLIDASPPSGTALIANLADFFHTDTDDNKTRRSGHILDVDTRWAKVFQVGVRAYRNMIEYALTKHDKVIVKSAKGNHDDHSILALAMMMKIHFDQEPRVEVELPINPFSYFRFGQVLLGMVHQPRKVAELPLVMAADQKEHWGETIFHHWLTGHVHHQSAHEFPGCTIESFRKPTPADYWTHASSYRALRDMKLIVYDRDVGEVSRTTYNTKFTKER